MCNQITRKKDIPGAGCERYEGFQMCRYGTDK